MRIPTSVITVLHYVHLVAHFLILVCYISTMSAVNGHAHKARVPLLAQRMCHSLMPALHGCAEFIAW